MVAKYTKPIFMVSSPRSGSTLLRLILNAHPNIAVPPPAYLFHFLYPYMYSYGDLSDDGNFRALAEDFLEVPTIEKWSLDLSADDIVAGAKERSFGGVFEFLHIAWAEVQGKPRWGSKSPRDGFWLDEIMACYPDAKIVHLLRDGRDVAIDLADANFQPHSVYCGALRWDECIKVVEDSASRLGPESFLEIRYEDLCKDPEATMRVICDFVGEDFAPEMMRHQETDSAKSWGQNPVHAAIMRPISEDYVGMYKTRLPDRDRSALDAVIGDTLARKGYSVMADAKSISVQYAAQMVEGDMVSQLAKAQYKYWHQARRKERRELGVWKDSDRESLLWGFD